MQNFIQKNLVGQSNGNNYMQNATQNLDLGGPCESISPVQSNVQNLSLQQPNSKLPTPAFDPNTFANQQNFGQNILNGNNLSINPRQTHPAGMYNPQNLINTSLMAGQQQQMLLNHSAAAPNFNSTLNGNFNPLNFLPSSNAAPSAFGNGNQHSTMPFLSQNLQTPQNFVGNHAGANFNSLLPNAGGGLIENSSALNGMNRFEGQQFGNQQTVLNGLSLPHNEPFNLDSLAQAQNTNSLVSHMNPQSITPNKNNTTTGNNQLNAFDFNNFNQYNNLNNNLMPSAHPQTLNFSGPNQEQQSTPQIDLSTLTGTSNHSLLGNFSNNDSLVSPHATNRQSGGSEVVLPDRMALRKPSFNQTNQPRFTEHQVIKINLMKHQLVLIMHSANCSDHPKDCNLKFCPTMKRVLEHAKSCVNSQCEFKHCQTTIMLIKHYIKCTNVCALCNTIKAKYGPCPPEFYEYLSFKQSEGSFQQYSELSQYQNGHSGIPNFLNMPQNGVHSDETELQSASPKDWKSKISDKGRSQIITSFLAEIIPTDDLSLIQEEKKNYLLLYAKQTEKEAFRSASTLKEYTDILSNKIATILQDYHSNVDTNNNNPKEELPVDNSVDTTDNENSQLELNQSQELKCDAKANQNLVENYSTPKNENEPMSKLPKIENIVNAENVLNSSGAENQIVDQKNSPLDQPSQPQPKNIKNKRYFTSDELKENYLPLMQKIIDEVKKFESKFVHPYSVNHLDLLTIKSKVEKGVYFTPFEFTSTVGNLFRTPPSMSKKCNKHHKFYHKIYEMLFEENDRIMQGFGYCCGRNYVYDPQDLVCQEKACCYIRLNEPYYIYGKYPYCEACFNGTKKDHIMIVEHITKPEIKVMKSKFERKINNKYISEEIAVCSECSLEFHKVCLNYGEWVYNSKFVCSACAKKYPETAGEVITNHKINARHLPTSHLSIYLENKANAFLEECDWRQVINESHIEDKIGKIVIRVTFNQNRKFSRFNSLQSWTGSTAKGGGDSSKPNDTQADSRKTDIFNYKIKNIMAFQEMDGKDICFFSMIVHEYGSDCPEPNRNRVYISYMDSVKVFKPPSLRTSLYHQILISYMSYVKKLGYTHLHIWACPPGENDDYIFYRHPPYQLNPKSKMLCDWYHRMLDKAKSLGVTQSQCDMLSFVKTQNLTDILDFPYFEGDFWATVIDECITQINTDLVNQRSKTSKNGKVKASNNLNSSSSELYSQSSISNSSSESKAKSKKSSPNRKITELPLYDKVFASVEKFKDIFFIVQMQPTHSRPIEDPDKPFYIELLDGRDNFLTFARENNYEFSSLRRSFYSTSHLISELLLQYQESLTCNECGQQIISDYHRCKICEEYDQCNSCFEAQKGHDHPLDLTKIAISYDVCKKLQKVKIQNKKASVSGSDIKSTANEESSKGPRIKLLPSNLINLNKILTHCYNCIDANCNLTDCAKLKKQLQHYKSCSKSAKHHECALCNKFFRCLFLYHAKNCEVTAHCPVPLCQMIKDRLEAQRVRRAAQEAAIINSRMTKMLNESKSAAPEEFDGNTSQCQNDEAIAESYDDSKAPDQTTIDSQTQITCTSKIVSDIPPSQPD